MGFVTILNILTELNTSFADVTSVTLFKRGSKPPASVAPMQGATPDDEEKGSGHGRHAGASDIDARRVEAEKESEEAIAKQPAMTDIFSWQHLRYTVPVGHGETRQLLDDVSGFVAPGKLTALMGESGAGKVRLLFHFLRDTWLD